MIILSATRAERLRWPLAALLVLALSSCGGGGGGSGSGVEQTPPPPRATTDPEAEPGGGPSPAVAAPTDIMITTAARALTVSWSPVAGAASYRVQWKSGDETYGADREAAAAGTSYTIPSLTAGQRYTVRVFAIPPGGGASAASMEMAAAPTASPQPPPSTSPPAPQPVSAAAPTGLGVAAAVQGLTVSWSAAAGAASYKVQWKSGSQSYSTEREAAVAGTATSHTLSSLIPGRTYTVRVLAVPAGGGSDLESAERTASPTPPSYAAVSTVRAWTSPPDGSRYPAETLQPATNPGSAASWRTAEYNATKSPLWQTACPTCPVPLEMIRAAEGYAACAGIPNCKPGGGGRTIAVIGTTLDVDTDSHTGHPDLQGARAINYQNIVSNDPHETRVAGIAAARRNGTGMHGVAFNANIIGYTTSGSNPGPILASVAGRPQEVNDFYTGGAAADSAHIANMSLSGGSDDRAAATWRAGMRIAAAAGRIMVIPTGNDPTPNPVGYPALAAGDEGIAGHAILVGGLDQTGTTRWGTISACGSLKAYCLFAPMRGSYTTTGKYNSSDSNGRYAQVFGTSMAAPYVAGAAAVVWAAFPNKTGAQIVRRLLTTASQTDVANGAYDATTGLSDIYGHGKLDLAAAMSAVGWTSTALPGGGLAPVRRSFVDLPPGFRLRPSAALARSVVYDEQMFPFLHDLNTAFRPHRARHSAARAMEEFLASLGGEWAEARLGERAAVEFASAEAKPHRDPRDPSGELGGYRLRTRLAPDFSLTLGRGFGAVGASSDFVARRLARGLLHDGLALGPFAALAGSGAELGAVWELDERTRLDLAGKDAAGYFGGGQARLASLGAARRFGDALTLGARWGRLRERGSLLGARGFGAFGSFGGAANTDFLDLSAERRLGRMTLFGSVSRGWTRAGAAPGGSLVAGWSGLRGDSFALGGEWPELWRRADRLTLIASSPFRARGAAVQVDVPEREIADGVVAYARHRADLSPRGRELRLQLAYETAAAPGAALSVGGYLRLEPEHDPAAKPEFGAAAKLRLRF